MAVKKQETRNALKKLVERNLTGVSKQELKRRKRIQKSKRAQTQPWKATEDIPITEEYEETEEMKKLKLEIAKELDTKQPTFVKRTRRVEPEYNFEGLTPGLAPIGYDPDESDEDPF